MAQWDGRGLPPVAAARVARAQSSGVRTSLLSADGAASLASVGLDPVGEVMGCVVESVGWRGWGGCGYGSVGFGIGLNGVRGGMFGADSQVIGSQDARWSGFGPYVNAIRRGYGTAMSRLLQEAQALGADGVVGVRLGVSMLDGAREFMALGTAVRARSQTRPQLPFTTDLPGSDVTKLMQAGWVPAQLIVGFDLAIKHDDWRTSQASRSWANVEVAGYTDLVQYTRHIVRTNVEQQTRKVGADGFIASAIQLTIREVEPSEGHRDHIAEALMVGTTIAQFAGAGAMDDRFGRRFASPAAPDSPTESRTVLPLGPILPTRRYRR